LCHNNFYISHPYSHACHYFHTHQPISCSCPPFLNGNHLWLPSSTQKSLQLSACISYIINHWPRWNNLTHEHIAQSTCYLTKEDKVDWENLSEFEATLSDWDTFKQALFREYPNARKQFISSADQGRFINEISKQEIHTLDYFATFHQEFRRLATRLEKRVSVDGLNKAYKKSIHPKLQDKILFYFSDEKTPCVKGEAFTVEYVREGAEHILEGFDHSYKMS